MKGIKTIILLIIAANVITGSIFLWQSHLDRNPKNPLKGEAMIESLVQRFLYYPVVLDRNAPMPYYVKGAREVWMKSGDGNEIHGLYWAPPIDRPTLLFFHGNAQSVFEWALIFEEFEPMECGLLLIDYPGYGKSSGKPSEAGLYAAGQAAYDWLIGEAKTPADKIIAFGKSLGGPVASKVAHDNAVMGLILESTFESIPAVARKLIPILPADAVFRSERYDTASRIEAIGVPVMVVHGTDDDLIPVEQGQALYNAAREPKKLYLVDGAGHNDVSMVAGQIYGRTLAQWLDSIK